MELQEKEILTIRKFDKFIYENSPSKEFLVQIIERAGSYLNLQTIPDYAKEKGLSYNGVKNNREIMELFGVKLVVDNE